jgi:hypothetical protein
MNTAVISFKAIEFASKKKYSRKETLMHLKKKGSLQRG